MNSIRAKKRQGQNPGDKGSYYTYSQGCCRPLGTRSWLQCTPQTPTGPALQHELQQVPVSSGSLLSKLSSPTLGLNSPGAPGLPDSPSSQQCPSWLPPCSHSSKPWLPGPLSLTTRNFLSHGTVSSPCPLPHEDLSEWVLGDLRVPDHFYTRNGREERMAFSFHPFPQTPWRL